uniref:FGF1 intracellular binding protein n=1 Tax=Sphenodon punctatus TaxID=8508 RepID=A0A8D0GUQ4_SPHPU
MMRKLLRQLPYLLNWLEESVLHHAKIVNFSHFLDFKAFVREVLGKKLSKGTKKDLDDISAKTGVTLKSCRRQFDNFKRVFKAVEELRGSLVENIQQHFLLSDRLARDYAAVVFFANSRFETGKKKLQFLTFEDFAFCAEQMIQNWTLGAVDTNVDDMDVDLDKEFLQDLKELKVLIGDKELLDLHKRLVCTSVSYTHLDVYKRQIYQEESQGRHPGWAALKTILFLTLNSPWRQGGSGEGGGLLQALHWHQYRPCNMYVS